MGKLSKNSKGDTATLQSMKLAEITERSSLIQALSQWGRSKKRAQDERDFFYQTPLVPRPLFQWSPLTESLEQAMKEVIHKPVIVIYTLTHTITKSA